MSLMGIDAGTSGAKVAAFREDGAMIALSRQGYPVHNPASGVFELDPREVWEAVCRGIREVATRCKGDPVTAISASSLGESFVLLDEHGRELCNSAMYYDLRGGAESLELLERMDSLTWKTATGVEPNRRQSLPKLMWLKRHQPGVYQAAHKLCLYADYILFKLGAPHAASPSLAGTTLACHLSGDWWGEGLEAAEIRGELLPPIRPSGTVLGQVEPGLADELGLPRHTVLVLGGHDQMLSAVGTGITSPAVAANSMGTSDAITPLVGGGADVVPLLEAGFLLNHYPLGNQRYSSVYNQNGGALINWVSDTFRLPEQYAGQPIYQAFEAAQTKPGPSNLLVLPHFGGRLDAMNRHSMKGAVLGLTYDVDSLDLYRAVLEGQAFELRMWLERFEALCGPIRELNTVGGAARSDKNLQLRADILGKQINRMACGEAGVLGAALLAGKGTGVYPDFQRQVAGIVKPARVFHPNPELRGEYTAQFLKYRQFYDRLA